MNFFKEDNWIRDLLFAVILLALIHHVIKDEEYTQIEVKKYTIMQQPFVAHEVDPAVIARIDRLEEQLAIIQQELERLRNETTDTVKQEMYTNNVHELEDIQQEVADIKGEYQTTSPALAFLGPIGSTSVVLKEKRLEKKLLESINQAINIADPKSTPAETIEQAKQSLMKIIDKLKSTTHKIVNPFEGLE